MAWFDLAEVVGGTVEDERGDSSMGEEVRARGEDEGGGQKDGETLEKVIHTCGQSLLPLFCNQILYKYTGPDQLCLRGLRGSEGSRQASSQHGRRCQPG